jgi:alanine dehydrogenase
MNEKAKNGNMSFGNTTFMPKEEQLETAVRHKKISIGIPNDKKNDEKRVALTPEAVNQLVENDNEVILQ